MAVEEEGLRVFQSVKIKIGEAKNLPTYPGPNKMRDCYCTVNLDREEVFRTKIVEKSLCPFYGEDFYCEIPRSFRHLSFYIFDRDVFRRDSIIGKVAIQKEDLPKYHNRDTWFQLQHVDADSEVQGKVHLELRLSEVITDTGVVCHKLAARSEAKKTKVKKKTNNPQFDEVFYFEVTRPCSYNRKSHFDFEEEDVDKLEIRVDLWNASNLKFGDEFLGELRVPLNVLRQSSSYEAWYFLQPRDNGSKSLKPGDLGSLRLNVVYTEDHVFSSDYYSPLRDLLLRSADVEPVSASAAHVLGEVCREKQEAAIPLVRLFLHYGRVVPFISAIANAEVRRTQDPNTIFRGNSLTSKCIDETMKLAGMHYLHMTLKPAIEEICQSHKSCEIDPVKLKDGESLENNMENLRQYVDRIFNVITKSGVSCPTVMCDIFFSLREAAAKRFQDDLDVRYTAVSSFIFLRFFAPAILSPNLFQLTPHHTDPQTSRTLTLISKTIQTLGSLSKSKSASFKESYMAAFYEFFNEQKYADAVKNFLDLISSSGRRDPKSIEQPILLKEGFMIKRAQGRKRFGMKNFKKRWFCLTNHEFTYQKSKGNKGNWLFSWFTAFILKARACFSGVKTKGRMTCPTGEPPLSQECLDTPPPGWPGGWGAGGPGRASGLRATGSGSCVGRVFPGVTRLRSQGCGTENRAPRRLWVAATCPGSCWECCPGSGVGQCPFWGLCVVYPLPRGRGPTLCPPPAPSWTFSTSGDQPLCSIPIENILAVEKLEEESFKMKNVSVLCAPHFSGVSPSSALCHRAPSPACSLVFTAVVWEPWSTAAWLFLFGQPGREEPAGKGFLAAQGSALGSCSISLKLNFEMVVHLQESCRNRAGPPVSPHPESRGVCICHVG
uniref:RAS p21 protein activator 3 n=1 Tax=Canis lupus familiaris TaxID=9615 RepID=A0A8C0RQS8_CANLF